MKKCILSIFLPFALFSGAIAQSEYGDVQEGEFGFTLGVATYFGDINTRVGLHALKPAVGIFYRKQFNNYMGVRLSAHYTELGYSDVYSENDYQLARNLSFNTALAEFAISGDFNFFKFIPGDPYHSFTPYVTIGIGVFNYNPYAYLSGQKYYLRPLGTEGQNIGYVGADGKTRKPYGSMAVCFPIGLGLKYSIANNLNLSIQIAERFTTTDYLDDVSTTYVGIANFPPQNGKPSIAGVLQDRSFERGVTIGVEGAQRGWSQQKDQYLIAEVGLSFNISTYKCPTAK
jgi:hypothetical protein